MSAEVSQSSRRYLWWIYLMYLIICLAWKSHALLVSNHQYIVFSCLAIFLDALGLFCLYCFIKQTPSFSRGFWILFSVFYLLKLIANIIALGYIVTNFPWSQGNANNALIMNCVGLILGIPLLIAIAQYAFGSKTIWSMQTD